MINGPHSPDLRPPGRARSAHAATAEGWPLEISSALDRLVHQLVLRGHHPRRVDRPPGVGQGPARPRRSCSITPGSEQVRATIERDGLLADLEAIGGTVLANACGPCIGQWDRTDLDPSKLNTIVNSYNRNFPKRNDGNANTLGVRHLARHGDRAGARRHARLRPAHRHAHQRRRRGGPPRRRPSARSCPTPGFDPGEDTLPSPRPPTARGVEVVVDPHSDRLQLLEPFEPWDGKDYVDLPVLLKAQGKCTTDHISAAGPWLKYRGHLENISGNLFLGAVNAFTGEAGDGQGPARRRDPAVPRHRQAPRTRPGIGWVRRRRRELRRGLAHASTPPWSPGSATPR